MIVYRFITGKRLLEKNDGRIWVESEVGKGSSFYFTLPINNPSDKINNLKEAEAISL